MSGTLMVTPHFDPRGLEFQFSSQMALQPSYWRHFWSYLNRKRSLEQKQHLKPAIGYPGNEGWKTVGCSSKKQSKLGLWCCISSRIAMSCHVHLQEVQTFGHRCLLLPCEWFLRIARCGRLGVGLCEAATSGGDTTLRWQGPKMLGEQHETT